MKMELKRNRQGNVLVTALMTITILTFICATSLYIASQNANAGLQAAGWQQALTGSENGVTKAIDALNTGTWTGWKTVGSTSLPTTQPTGGSTATAAPTGSQVQLLSALLDQHDG